MTRHPIWRGVAAAVFLVAPGAAALAAEDASTEGSPCDVISTEQINALSTLQYGEPGSDAGMCIYDEAPNQEGPHTVRLQLYEGFTLDDFRSGVTGTSEYSPGEVDVMVGDRPGYTFAENLYVDVGGAVLWVDVWLWDSAESSGVYPDEYLIDIAEAALGNLGEGADPVDEADSPVGGDTAIAGDGE